MKHDASTGGSVVVELRAGGLIKAGATSTLTILPGAGHEDPVFMATQMAPTFAFLDRAFGR